MSKEIAQTVGGKKIAYLLAILSALAVLAYLATNGKVSEAAEVSDQAPLVLDVAVDAAIPGGGNFLTVGATAEVQVVGDILTDALTIRLTIRESVPQNGQTTQTADMIKTGANDVSNNVHASSFWDQSRNSSGTFTAGNFDGLLAQGDVYSADVSRSLNPWSTVSNSSTSGWDFFHKRYGSGEVIASSKDVTNNLILPDRSPGSAINLQEGVGPSDNSPPSSSSKVDAKSAAGGGVAAVWLYATLGLGALTFGVAVATTARRSR